MYGDLQVFVALRTLQRLLYTVIGIPSPVCVVEGESQTYIKAKHIRRYTWGRHNVLFHTVFPLVGRGTFKAVTESCGLIAV